MTEFDSTAFSAVDSFFVIDRKPDDDKEDHPSAKIATGKARRLGVGASVTKEEPSVATTAASKLLKVGKKKRGQKNDNEIEEDEANYDEGDDEEEEEEIGRTGIASEPSKSEKPTESASGDKKRKRKRKKGKKERNIEKELQNEADENNASKTQGDTADVDKESELNKQNDSKKNDNDKQKRKRKRRRVRSRQKNIYKDNRPLDEKPDHLVPGGYDYKGRPITPATKAKLVSKNILPANSTVSSLPKTSNDDADEDMGTSMGEGFKTAPTDRQTKTTKKGKPKYKNLQ